MSHRHNLTLLDVAPPLLLSSAYQINDIRPESRTFNLTCVPCKLKLNTIEDLNHHCRSKEHLETITNQLLKQYPDLEANVGCKSMFNTCKHCNTCSSLSNIVTRVSHSQTL